MVTTWMIFCVAALSILGLPENSVEGLGLHEIFAVDQLSVNEIIAGDSSNPEFSWIRCDICASYEVKLLLEAKNEVIENSTLKLRPQVSSLSIQGVPPKTKYYLTVKVVPDVGNESKLSGRTGGDLAPPPVSDIEEFVGAHEVGLSWRGSGDGFAVAIVDDSGHPVNYAESERKSMEFTYLKPKTKYVVHISAFYSPRSNLSSSLNVSKSFTTLPEILPDINLSYKISSDAIVDFSWTNPTWPVPVNHTLICNEDGGSQNLTVGGRTESIIIARSRSLSSAQCSLATHYSRYSAMKISSSVTVVGIENSCSGKYRGRDGLPPRPEVEEIVGPDQANELSIHLSREAERMELNYRLCSSDGCLEWERCSYPGFSLKASESNIKPWTKYSLQLRNAYRCEQVTVELPGLRSAVAPVEDLAYSDGVLQWSHPDTIDPPSVLISHCTSMFCRTYRLRPNQQHFTLSATSPFETNHVLVQAIRGDEVIVLSPSVDLMFQETRNSSEKISLELNNAPIESEVEVRISYEDDPAAPAVVQYHVSACGSPLDLSGEQPSPQNSTCQRRLTQNSTFVFIRRPWTLYNLTVSACYGRLDSNVNATISLPIFKSNPPPLSGLFWQEQDHSLSWVYSHAWQSSGFLIKICPSKPAVSACADIEAAAIDRNYNIDFSSLIGETFSARVKSIIKYGNETFHGPASEITLTRPSANVE